MWIDNSTPITAAKDFLVYSVVSCYAWPIGCHMWRFAKADAHMITESESNQHNMLCYSTIGCQCETMLSNGND